MACSEPPGLCPKPMHWGLVLRVVEAELVVCTRATASQEAELLLQEQISHLSKLFIPRISSNRNINQHAVTLGLKMYVHSCAHTCTHIHVCTHVHTHIHVHAHTCMHTVHGQPLAGRLRPAQMADASFQSGQRSSLASVWSREQKNH